MGIPSYFSHIVRQHRKIIKPINFNNSPKINNLYLDCNSFIYDAVSTIVDDTSKTADEIEQFIIRKACDNIGNIGNMGNGNFVPPR